MSRFVKVTRIAEGVKPTEVFVNFDYIISFQDVVVDTKGKTRIFYNDGNNFIIMESTQEIVAKLSE